MRIIAFGCSNTFGHGLPDCWDDAKKEPLSNPSTLAWPQKLAEALLCGCVNDSMCGMSNKWIFHRILKFDYDPDDIPCVMWSHHDRYTILKKPKRNGSDQFETIGPWIENKINKAYFKSIYNEYDSIRMMEIYMYASELHLRRLGLKSVQFYNGKYDDDKERDFTDTNARNIGKFKNIAPMDMHGIKHRSELALDNGHWGVDAHVEVAGEYYKVLDDDVKLANIGKRK